MLKNIEKTVKAIEKMRGLRLRGKERRFVVLAITQAIASQKRPTKTELKEMGEEFGFDVETLQKLIELVLSILTIILPLFV